MADWQTKTVKWFWRTWKDIWIAFRFGKHRTPPRAERVARVGSF